MAIAEGHQRDCVVWAKLSALIHGLCSPNKILFERKCATASHVEWTVPTLPSFSALFSLPQQNQPRKKSYFLATANTCAYRFFVVMMELVTREDPEVRSTIQLENTLWNRLVLWAPYSDTKFLQARREKITSGHVTSKDSVCMQEQQHQMSRVLLTCGLNEPLFLATI